MEKRVHPLADQLKHQPFPRLAGALRARANAIADSWMKVTLDVMPQMERLKIEELRGTIPQILEAIALAMASSERHDLQTLIEQAPEHGFARFVSEHSVMDLFEEERLLRGVMAQEIESELNRQLTVAEAAALHATIDIMVQQSVMAMMDKQKQHLRKAAEGEVKYMAFLGHDLSNNLFVIDASLDALSQQLQSAPEWSKSLEMINMARTAIGRTTKGMRRLLEHERLRKSGARPQFKRLNLHKTAQSVAKQFDEEARKKGLNIDVKTRAPDEELTLETDEELVSLVLQNLMGNAVKYSERGTVEVTINRIAPQENEPKAWNISVVDHGPGIEPKQQEKIFESFKRGEAFGHEGVGLGLAIAAQATKLLDGELTVDSKRGEGSTFSLKIPEQKR